MSRLQSGLTSRFHLALTLVSVVSVCTLAAEESLREDLRDELKDMLKPAAVSFGENGLVTIDLDRAKLNNLSEELELLEPRPGPKLLRNHPFRSAGGRGSGLRVTEKGQAFLNCWFSSVQDAEMDLVPVGTTRDTGVFRLGIGKKKGLEVGVDYRGRVLVGSKTLGSRKALPVIQGGRPIGLKISIKEGKLHTHRNGVASSPVSVRKQTSATRMGFQWADCRVFVHRLKVTGVLDAKKMTDILTKRARKKGKA